MARNADRLRRAAAAADRRLARLGERLRAARRRAGAWRRETLDPRLAPVTGPVAAWAGPWRDRLMASEMAPPRLSRPGRPEAITAAAVGVLVVAFVVFLALFDWNWLRGPAGRWASDRFGRDIRIEGDLDVDVFSWTPTVTVHRLKVGGPAWADGRDTADLPRLQARVPLMPLLAGRLEFRSIEATRPSLVLLRDAEGRRSWDFGDADASDEPPDLPPIRRLTIDAGRLAFADALRDLEVTATVSASETAPAEGETGGEGGFRLTGEGTLNGNPLSLTLSGGPLVHVRRDRPYDFTAELSGGGTRMRASGAIARPFDLGRFEAQLEVAGADLADIYLLTGLTTPNTPPYDLEGRLTRRGERWTWEGFSGRVGDSDLAGDLMVEKRGGRRWVEATLTSRSLDLDDLMAVVGGPPDPGETASPQQQAMAGRLRSQGRLLPDAPLYVERLRSMDGRLDFRAAAVRRNAFTVSAVRLGVGLESGVLTIDPVAFAFDRGRLNGRVRVDGSRDVPHTDLDLRLTGFPVQSIIPARGGAPTVTGSLQARARLQGPGASVRQLADNAQGSIALAVQGGEIREAFAELLGINVGRGLLLLLSGDEDTTPIRCGVAGFTVSGGVAAARTFVIDTDAVRVDGSGTIDLGAERLDLKLDGETKRPRLLRVWAPITVTGPIRSPSLGVEGEAVAGQVGLAALVGAVTSGLAAILPFLDPGLAEDADCAALMAGRPG